jgi:molybdopterin/thiamine biosynthesis adenylyltransferase
VTAPLDPGENRLERAGADLLSLYGTKVFVAAPEEAAGTLFAHPVWPLCRALAASGFESVTLLGPEAYGEEIAGRLEDFAFSFVPRARQFEYDADGCDLLLQLGTDLEGDLSLRRLRQSRAVDRRWATWAGARVMLESAHAGEGSPAERAAARGDLDAPLAPIGRIVAGLLVQEALIVAARLEGATQPDPLVSVDAAHQTGHPGSALRLEGVILEILGAGAVGTNVAESITPLLGRGCELRLVDFDRVGPENLAVQSAYGFEDIGRPKAVAIAEKLSTECHPAADIRPFPIRYEDLPRRLQAPSLRIACPDSFAARKLANDRSLADGVPLVEGGTSPLAAQVRSYLPGRSACLEHRIRDLAGRAAREQAPASCAAGDVATLPGTTMICGGLIALEALKALLPERLGSPSSGTLVYDARFPNRFGVEPPQAPCRHGQEAG